MLTAHEERAPVHQFIVDFFLPPPRFVLPLNCSNMIPSSSTQHTHIRADYGSQHQSVMEGGTSLAGGDRGEGG